MCADTITITREEYEALRCAAAKLASLQSHGVDNWEWYEDAMERLG